MSHFEMYSLSSDDIGGQYINSRALLTVRHPSIPIWDVWHLAIISAHSMVGITKAGPLKNKLALDRQVVSEIKVGTGSIW